MTAKASIVKEAVYDVLTVPYDCVTTDEDGNSSVTIDKDGEKVQVPVTVGMQSDYYVEISGDDIEEGTVVYYSTPMVNNPSSGDSSSDSSQDGVIFDMGGGSMAAALAAVVIPAAVERLAAALVDFRPGGSYGRTTQYD